MLQAPSIPYFLAKKPHAGATIESVMLDFEIPELHSAISLFARNGLSGAFPHRDDYRREHLPTEYSVLEVWTHMHFYCSPPNEFYPPELRQLWCKSTNKDGRVLFDPILVRVTTG